jgi:hypothetical protein
MTGRGIASRAHPLAQKTEPNPERSWNEGSSNVERRWDVPEMAENCHVVTKTVENALTEGNWFGELEAGPVFSSFCAGNTPGG